MCTNDSLSNVETASARFYLDKGVGIMEFKDRSVIDLAEARANADAFDHLVGREVPLLVIFGKLEKQTKEARDFFSSDPRCVGRFSACALLTKNPLSRVFANFYTGINRPPKPTRMFSSRQRALEWLEGFL